MRKRLIGRRDFIKSSVAGFGSFVHISSNERKEEISQKERDAPRLDSSRVHWASILIFISLPMTMAASLETRNTTAASFLRHAAESRRYFQHRRGRLRLLRRIRSENLTDFGIGKNEASTKEKCNP